MTKQRILGILTLLSLLIGAALTVMKGGSADLTTLIPAGIAALGLILHPPTDGGAAVPAK